MKNKRNQKYYLHRKVKEEGYRVASRKKTIYAHFTNVNFSKYIRKLQDEFGYVVQMELG